MKLDEFRSRFPIFKRRVYVNSCSQGALSIDVDEAMRAFLDSWHESGSPWEMWVDQVERLRARFAASIGAEVDEIAVMPSASAGINAVASALSFDGRRSRVVIGDFEFPTMAQIWLAQERRGASIRRAQASPASPDRLPVRSVRRGDRRAHADRSRDARLLPQRPQDRHRRSRGNLS
jgi:selenocysteine lyase/cysteine desulfurase